MEGFGTFGKVWGKFLERFGTGSYPSGGGPFVLYVSLLHRFKVKFQVKFKVKSKVKSKMKFKLNVN